MTDPTADKPTTLNQSGGVTIHAETVNITGDVIGRDGINAGGGGSRPPTGGSSGGSDGSTGESPSLELAVRITAAAKTLQVSVAVRDLDLEQGPFRFVLPFNEAVLTELRWYLELYPQWPVGPDYERARGVEANLRIWGKQLFDAVFAEPDARSVYADFRNSERDRRHIAIYTTDPQVLRLPWELLADEQGYLFTKRRPIGIRRRIQKSQTTPRNPFQLPVNVLMVVSRPDDAGFIDPRSSAEALLNAIKPIRDRVNVEFLYPPTLDALDDRLGNSSLPAVHVVHFDGHGVYDAASGLGYLAFEQADHKTHLVDAEHLGNLLNETGVPLMVLDACQSAKADLSNPFGSVAARLIEVGIGSVLAMNYSVLVPAAELLTAAFYGALAEGKTIGQAVDAARRKMLAKTGRLELYREGREETIHLQDWFLPALFQQARDPAPFAAGLTAPTAASAPPPSNGMLAGRFPAEPLHGFHGREKELLHLQRVLHDHAAAVVHGFGGQGKTTLAAHAARWFTRTGRFKRAVFVSFESGENLDVTLSEMGTALVDGNFAIYPGNKLVAIGDALQAVPTLVIWDNFESVLAKGNAPLSDGELMRLLDAAAQWFIASDLAAQANGSRLLITTRLPEIPHGSLQPSQAVAYTPLPGLWPSDALALTGQILKDNSIDRPPRDGLIQLLGFLGNHPLSIQLVVPQLRTYTPDKLITEFDALLPGFTTGAGQERNESLRVSLDFSLRRLGEDTRQLLPDLAVFQHGGMEAQVLKVTQWKPSQWRLIRDELARAALLTIDQGAAIGRKTEEGPFSGYYVRFHPTLLPYLATRLTPARRAELEPRYGQAYYALANHCYRQDNQDPIPTRAIVSRELPNFRRALDLTLAAGDLNAAANFADSIAKFLNVFGRWSERDAMMGEVEKEIRKQGDKGQSAINTRSEQSKMVGGPSSTVTQAEYLMAAQQGERLLQQGRAAQAEKVFRDLLARLGDAPSYERAVTLRYIGLSLAAQGKQSEAAEFHRQKLSVLAQLEQTQQVKRETGIAHTDLADVLAEMGQFDAARREYEATLVIMREINDDRSVAAVLGQLGTLALRQNDLNEARRRYVEALAIFRNSEPQSEAVLWHQLGRVAQEAKDWPEAERCYKESLGLKERLNDAAGAARTSNQLALVAVKANRPDEAERWYKRAIELKEQAGNPQQLASSLSNLADLYLSQGRLDEAEQYVRRAIEIDETLDLSVEPWKDYSIMALIADKRGRVQEARQWRKKADETYAAYVDRSGGQANQNVRQWEPVIQGIVAACNGDTQVAQQLEPFFQQMETQDDWRNLIPVLRRILAGERGIELTEGLDRTDAAIVRRVLQLLTQPSPPAPLPTSGEGSAAPPSPVGEGRGEGDGATPDAAVQALNQFLGIFVAGARGDSQAGNAAYKIARDMQSATQPPEVRAMGKGLQNVLEGLRGEEAVRGLPPQVADIVQMVLQQIGHG